MGGGAKAAPGSNRRVIQMTAGFLQQELQRRPCLRAFAGVSGHGLASSVAGVHVGAAAGRPQGGSGRMGSASVRRAPERGSGERSASGAAPRPIKISQAHRGQQLLPRRPGHYLIWFSQR